MEDGESHRGPTHFLEKYYLKVVFVAMVLLLSTIKLNILHVFENVTSANHAK